MPDNAPAVVDMVVPAAAVFTDAPVAPPMAEVSVQQDTPREIPTKPEVQPDGKVRHEIKPDNKDKISWDDFLPEGDKPKSTEVPKQEVKEPLTKGPTRADVLKELGVVDAEEISDYAKMSNTAFERVKKTLAKQREVEKRASELELELKKPRTGELPANYYEHPEGYQLHPDYTKTVDNYQRASQETRHWEQQYARIRKAENWQDLEVDEKGNLKLVEREPTAEGELAVLGYIQNGRRILQENSQKIESLKQQFKNRYENFKNEIVSEEDKHFPSFKDEKYVKENPYYGVIRKALEEKGQNNNPLTGMFSKLYATHMELRGKYAELMKQQEAKATVVQQQQKAGPSSSGIAAGATPRSAQSNDRVSWSEFEAITNS